MAVLDVTHLPDLGHAASAARSDALRGGRRNTRARSSKAGARPDVGVESGTSLGVPTDDCESLATFHKPCTVVFLSEQQIVDLGETTRLNRSQA